MFIHKYVQINRSIIKRIFSILTLFFLPFPALAMVEDESTFKNLPHMRIEKQSDLEAMFKEYHDNKRPLALAVCCGCKEIPDRIRYIYPFYSTIMERVKDEYQRRGGSKARSEEESHEAFEQILKAVGAEDYPNFLSFMCGFWIPFVPYDPNKSGPPPQENWISLDLYLTDSDLRNGGPHIRMDVLKRDHWQELSKYLSLNSVKLRTIVITGYPPQFESPVLRDLILPLLEEGGQLVFRAYHASPYIAQSDFAPINNNGKLFLSCLPSINTYIEDVRRFHLEQTDTLYQNVEALIDKTMQWVGKEEDSIILKKLKARVYANRVACFDKAYYEAVVMGKLDQKSFPDSNSTERSELFTKSETQLTQEGIEFFRQYLDEIQFPIQRYRIVAKPQVAAKYGLEEYTYPQDGTHPLVYDDGMRLVFVK